MMRPDVGTAELAISLVRIAFGMALVALFYWGWLAEPLERQVRLMGTLFETDYANLSTQNKIRAVVLVTMLSLLLELVLIRWLASVFPVFAFYKNFTMLACFLGLGAGYAVAEKQRCAPALVLPMASGWKRYSTSPTSLVPITSCDASSTHRSTPACETPRGPVPNH
jgi:ABC-type transport system involved in cytochrome c biogenesis permease subunit